MSKSTQKRNKKYTGKYRNVLPITIRYNAADEQELSLNPHLELDKLSYGVADDGCFNQLALRLNVAKVIAENHFADGLDTMCAGLASLIMVRERQRRVAKWGASDAERTDIGNALNMADSLQIASTRRIQRDAMRFVIGAQRSAV